MWKVHQRTALHDIGKCAHSGLSRFEAVKVTHYLNLAVAAQKAKAPPAEGIGA
jgi:hypothetical protein